MTKTYRFEAYRTIGTETTRYRTIETASYEVAKRTHEAFSAKPEFSCPKTIQIERHPTRGTTTSICIN